MMSTYDGDLIAQPEPRLTRLQQLELLMRHPMFTGLCPQCRHQFDPVINHVCWDCPNCGCKHEVGRSC